LLHSRSEKAKPEKLSAPQLRKAILQALNSEHSARFIQGKKLFEKLEGHGVTIEDLFEVCRKWKVLRSPRWQKGMWRYRIEGYNCDNRWMAAVVAVQSNPTVVVAITGFHFSRGNPKQ